ncbi:alanine dehydrogenase [Peribacillus frigoritolerans]|jgi:alanine dehydrogenase|uniref:alanine dehydrogenase n=1 Tax=Peribacillus TaxID=2675229 RepID=UPI000559286A|nr:MULTISPECIES: alanine dehydrogenase [Peribacillus]KOR84269.1 alanine dehydrogenase [Bacillus sp. FJAT-22058]KRF59966.1 alanine dehydrogenase [Bacillus sp. Soil745]MBD8138179.1 alanine dehydrogenase [Bacillus sp. CFBP 13597]MCD1159550.1 alanine dehydrogenase [Peribacillus castrilensis]PAW31055.1 alanine dehydrogenase [Peribacillus simplex]PEF40979.1 alanine dehydrogenase [Bacillus sp. AFS094228]PEO48239.1 alanine dehydrogenase [Bacillus sp. AFS026049]PHD76097.1 alanine dehydrogenase [Baci
MRIGIPKEIKNNENRVAITPAGVVALVNAGHEVLIEMNAGLGSSFTNEAYQEAGAVIVEDAASVWASTEMIMKVKEPISSEYKYFRKDLILFTYLHLAAEPALAQALKESGVLAIAYETVAVNRTLPLLTPMSEVAGRMAAQIGAQFLEKNNGGKGILLSGVPGVKRGKVAVIGGGMVGTNAAKIAIGLGADVTILDLSPDRLRQLDDIFGNELTTLISNPYNIAEAVKDADLVIGAVLIPGAKAPKLVTEEMVKTMSPGSVIVDVAIDQGGIFETVDHITTHDNPTYVKHGVVHYAVANMPGAVPQTSTVALTNVTVPFALQIANKGAIKAILENDALAKGVNVANGEITFEAVATDLGYNYVSVENALNPNNINA